MKKNYAVLIFLVALQIATAQTSSTFVPKVNNIPSSPEAAMLGRFGDIPVGYYTGTADISIPLYTISEGGVEVPITLSYHPSGIKVADEATWVGLGWTLDPGGAIIQEVRGKEDQIDNFYNWSNPTSSAHLGGTGNEYNVFKGHLDGVGFATPQVGDCLKVPVCYAGTWTCDGATDPTSVLNSLLSNNGQPDIYYYNFPGYSGKFYTNPETGVLVFIGKKENLSILNTTITTPDGTIYNFGATEVSHASVDASGYTNKLSSIQCTNGKSINFTYASENYGTLLKSSSVVLNPYETGGVSTPTNFTSSINGTKQRLTQIETSDAYINFIPEAREDLSSTSGNTLQRLKAIEIVSKVSGKIVKSFQFTYSYFGTGTDYHSKRLKLESVKEIGYSDTNPPIQDTSKPAYVFSYDTSVNLPVKESNGVDFFGYYNGQDTNSTLIPDLRYFEYENDSRYATFSNPNFSYVYTGANRFVDNTKAKAWMLNKILYPTGGSTAFEYEPHTYTNQFLPTVQQHYTAFDSNSTYRAITNSGNPSSASLTLHVTHSGTLYFNNTFSHGFPLNPSGLNNPISNIYNNKLADGTPEPPGTAGTAFIRLTKTLNGVETDIKLWTPSNVNLQTYEQFVASGNISWSENVYIEYESGATYKVYVSFPTYTYTPDSSHPYSIAQTYMQVRFSDHTLIDTTTGYGGGFRVKSIKSYTSEGILASYKQISYTGGKLVNRFEPLEYIDARYTETSPVATQPDCGSYRSNTVYRKRITMSSDDFGLNGGNPIGYSKVEEVELSGTVTNGKKSFYYINGMNGNIKGYPTDLAVQNGFLLKEEVWNRAGAVLHDKTYIYGSLGAASFYGIKIIQNSIGNVDYDAGVDMSPLNIGRFTYKFSYFLYPITAGWWALTNTVTNDYYNGTPVTTSEDITYTASGLKKTITTTLDAGNVNKTMLYYPGEIAGAPPIETTMVTNKMTGIPIQTEQYKNNELLSSQKTQYNSFNGKILPAYVFAKKGNETGIPFEQRVSMTYDLSGNIQQYLLTGGTPVVLIWGYNKTQPIAKIENATEAEVQIALGGTTYIPLNAYTEADIAAIDALRSNTSLAKAQITTYTYRPLVGVTSITDPKGNKISYTYDNFGRLIEVRDRYNNVLSQNQYNYRP